MPPKVVDSVGWIAYFMDDPVAKSYEEYIVRQWDIICPSIVVYEVSKKIEQQSSAQASVMAVAQLMKTRIVPLDTSIATFAAKVSIVHKLSVADSVIYATTLLSHATLMTSDAHFKDLPHVQFIPLP